MLKSTHKQITQNGLHPSWMGIVGMLIFALLSLKKKLFIRCPNAVKRFQSTFRVEQMRILWSKAFQRRRIHSRRKVDVSFANVDRETPKFNVPCCPWTPAKI